MRLHRAGRLLAAVALALSVAPTGDRDAPRLRRPAGDVAVAAERLGAALHVGAAAPLAVTVERPSPGRDVAPRPPEGRGKPLLWVDDDLTYTIAGGPDPGAVLPPFERDVDDAVAGPSPAPKGPLRRSRPPLSVVTGVLLGPRAVTGLTNMIGSDPVDGPAPERDRSNDLSVRVHPRFAAGGMQCEISWEF